MERPFLNKDEGRYNLPSIILEQCVEVTARWGGGGSTDEQPASWLVPNATCSSESVLWLETKYSVSFQIYPEL